MAHVSMCCLIHTFNRWILCLHYNHHCLLSSSDLVSLSIKAGFRVSCRNTLKFSHFPQLNTTCLMAWTIRFSPDLVHLASAKPRERQPITVDACPIEVLPLRLLLRHRWCNSFDYLHDLPHPADAKHGIHSSVAICRLVGQQEWAAPDIH